jgi:UDP-glucose 4-epimerase
MLDAQCSMLDAPRMERVFVTGAAGFIGSSLCDRLLADGLFVTGWDNFSTGRKEFLEKACSSKSFRLIVGDNLDRDELRDAMAGSDFVFHLAANADVRFGLEHPEKDLQQNTLATFNVLEAMRLNGIKGIAFSSTGSVYGETQVFPTPEDAPFPEQTSLYGASKLAGEALIQAYCEGFGFTGFIFRFVSILGERYTHGHVFDFVKKLLADPTRLPVLGDGKQRKSYLYVQDCLDGILHIIRRVPESAPHKRCFTFNLGTNEYCTVTDSAGWICERLGVHPTFEFSGGERGWVGDNPFIFLDISRALQTGWKPKLTIRDAVVRTTSWLMENPGVLERH